MRAGRYPSAESRQVSGPPAAWLVAVTACTAGVCFVLYVLVLGRLPPRPATSCVADQALGATYGVLWRSMPSPSVPGCGRASGRSHTLVKPPTPPNTRAEVARTARAIQRALPPRGARPDGWRGGWHYAIEGSFGALLSLAPAAPRDKLVPRRHRTEERTRAQRLRTEPTGAQRRQGPEGSPAPDHKMASRAAPLAAAGEQRLREKLRRDAHGTEQTYVARQRRAQRMAHLTGTAVERVYRVSPTRNAADYDPEELYLHLRDEHDLRVEEAKEQPYSPPRNDAGMKAPSRRVRLATADQVGRALLEASKRRKREAALGVPPPLEVLDSLRHETLGGD